MKKDECINCRYWTDKGPWIPEWTIGEPEFLITYGFCNYQNNNTFEDHTCPNFERPENAAD